MSARDWLAFWASIAPDLVRFARELFRRHGGDVRAARTELRRITDHGARLDAAEEEFRARLAAEEARRKG